MARRNPSDLIAPTRTQFTRMPWGASAAAKFWVRFSSPALAAPYAVWIGSADTAAPDEMLTIDAAARARRMCGATRCESTNALLRLRSIMFWNRSAFQSSNA